MINMADTSEKTIITLKLKEPRELAEEIFGAANIYGVARNAFRIDIVLKGARVLTTEEEEKIKAAFPKFKIHKIQTQKGRLEIER